MEISAKNVDDLDPDRFRLLKNKLGRLLIWQRPQIVASVGPFRPEVFQRFEHDLQDVMEKCQAALAGYSDGQIAGILKGLRGGGAIAEEWNDFLRGDIQSLERRMPAWHAGGFGHPDHVADFNYWTKMPTFDLGELTCLTVGISPNEYPTSMLAEMSYAKDRDKFSPVIEFLVMRFELYQRNFDPYNRGISTTPSRFIGWVDQVQENVHPGFLEPLRIFQLKQKTVTDVTSVKKVEKVDKREVDTIAQLFTALAIDFLGYKPGMLRSPIPKEIASLAASLGMTVTDETVRKYLRTGEKFIAHDWVPPDH